MFKLYRIVEVNNAPWLMNNLTGEIFRLYELRKIAKDIVQMFRWHSEDPAQFTCVDW